MFGLQVTNETFLNDNKVNDLVTTTMTFIPNIAVLTLLLPWASVFHKLGTMGISVSQTYQVNINLAIVQ